MGRTTALCLGLDGITLPASNAFWDMYTPPNHWRCRSRLRRGSEVKAAPETLPELKPEFEYNPAKAGSIYSPKHPYFDTLPDDIRDTILDLAAPSNGE